jgi:small-conductance mechanosensitive channel
MLIGAEYHAAAVGLTGKRRASDTSLRQALEENKQLRRELGNTRQQLKELTKDSIDEALRLIDQLDEDNRLLRGRVRILDQRLREREIAMPAGGAAQARARPSIGLVPDK